MTASAGTTIAYKCQSPDCRRVMNTILVDDGTTPMMKVCEYCKAGRSLSLGPTSIPQVADCEFEWYQPDAKEMRTLEWDVFQHVQNGGLLFRRRGGQEST